MFKRKEQPLRVEDLFQPQLPQIPNVVIVRENEYRPCWVAGRKAVFHRWANNARAILPKGEEPGENSRYFQYRSTKAIVEYQDGTVDTVWPQDIQFADAGPFDEITWPQEDREESEC